MSIDGQSLKKQKQKTQIISYPLLSFEWHFYSYAQNLDHTVDVNFVIVVYKHVMYNRLPILACIPER